MSRTRRAKKRTADTQQHNIQPASIASNESMQQLWELAAEAEKRQKSVPIIKIKRPRDPQNQEARKENPFIFGAGQAPFVLPTTFKHGLKVGEGFIVVPFGTKKIYISTHEKAEDIAKHYDIPEANQVDLSEIADKDLARDPTVSAQFTQCVSILTPEMNKVLFHCFDGLSRAPLAALIYMSTNGMNANDARNAINTSMRIREQNFKLDPKGYYPTVLQDLGIEQTRNRAVVNYAE